MQGFSHDANDARIHSSGSSKYYVNGANGQTEAVVDVTNPGVITHNIWGNDLVGLPAVSYLLAGQVRRNGSLTRYYHLSACLWRLGRHGGCASGAKDHLACPP
jgi:hypothetical protein